MRRMTCFVMALAMVLGLTQCKKEQPVEPNQNEGVRITLTVDSGNNGSRAIVDPTNGGANNYASVAFENDDVIYVAYNGAYVGTLTYSDGMFSGSVDISSYDGVKPLLFYFLGGKGFTPILDGNSSASVVISDQSMKYPARNVATSRRNGSENAPLAARGTPARSRPSSREKRPSRRADDGRSVLARVGARLLD